MDQSIESMSVFFDWNNIKELELCLRKFETVGWSRAAESDQHCNLLRELGQELCVTDMALKNAIELAEGRNDLAVLLQEPADSEATAHHSLIVPPTIQCVNDELRTACRTRDWHNTCILDIRPFRSKAIRKRDAFEEHYNNIAYESTKSILDALKPDVILLCQSETKDSTHGFARAMSSSIGQFGDIFLHTLDSGKQVVVICSFHPMHALRQTTHEDPIVGRVRSLALRFTFLQAVNILRGRIIRGPGLQKLRDAVYGASQSPHMLLQTGKLDVSLDNHRFKGVFLAENASLEFKALWEKLVSKKSAEEERKMRLFASILQGFRVCSNVTWDLHDLQGALPDV